MLTENIKVEPVDVHIQDIRENHPPMGIPEIDNSDLIDWPSLNLNVDTRDVIKTPKVDWSLVLLCLTFIGIMLYTMARALI